MATVKQEAQVADRIKKIVATALVVIAIGTFYAFSDASLLLRVLGLVVVVFVAAGIFLTTVQGHEIADFLKASRVELHKMIWPTKTETSQTTLIVIVAVIIVALFLWLIDLLLRWFMQIVIQ